MEPTLYRAAVYEGVTRHAFRTVTHRNMVDHFANSAGTTCARAGINTFLIHTRTIPWTFRTQHTLGTAGDIRISLIFSQTRALSVTRANGIVATGTRVAGITWFLIGGWCYRIVKMFNFTFNYVFSFFF